MGRGAATPRAAFISIHGDPAIAIGGEEAGGQNVYVRHLGEALAHRGWHVDMYSRRADPHLPQIVTHKERCRTIRLEAGPAAPVSRQEGFVYLEAFLDRWHEFARLLPAYDLIHSHYWLSGWVGLQLQSQLGIPLVHNYHSLGIVKYRTIETVPTIAATRLQTERDCLERANCVVATSPQERDDLRGLVSTKGHIEVIPGGTDVRRFGGWTQARGRDRLGIDAETLLVLYIGRFDPRKGIETLVRAAARLHQQPEFAKHLQLWIGGGSTPGQPDGNERDRLEDLAAALGLGDRARFLGRIDDADLPACYAAADVCAIPSYYEPFGLVAIEAMAAGTPVVASTVGGLQHTVVPEETGLLVPPKDDAALAGAIARVLAAPAWGARLGANGRARVAAKFAWEGVAAQIETLYQDLLQARSPQA